MAAGKFIVEVEPESDGCWIAEIVALPGVMAYGHETMTPTESPLEVAKPRYSTGFLVRSNVSVSSASSTSRDMTLGIVRVHESPGASRSDHDIVPLCRWNVGCVVGGVVRVAHERRLDDERRRRHADVRHLREGPVPDPAG